MRPQFPHGLPYYAVVAAMQAVVDRCHKMWDASKVNSSKYWTDPYVFQDFIGKCVRAFGNLMYESQSFYDRPVELTDVEREAGVHILTISFVATQVAPKYIMTVRSDKPRTCVSLYEVGFHNPANAGEVNIFEPIFGDQEEPWQSGANTALKGR